MSYRKRSGLTRSAVLCLVLTGLFAPCSADRKMARADELKADVKKGKALLEEGDDQADQGKTTEAVIRYKHAFEQLLPGMRKLPFKSEVKRDVAGREELKALLIKEIDEEMTPGEFRANELGMKALGLLPWTINLKRVMVKVYSEEIAAFYDTKTKTMFLIKESADDLKKTPTFLERLLGKKRGFDKDENKTVIAHELTHALADQNFNIDAMQKAIKHDDDRDLALSALIEGEATLCMMGAQMNDWNGSKIRQVPAANLDRVFSLMMPLMPMTGGKSLREAPVILSESMIFPYLRGLVFCANLTNHGGWEALNEAYRRPPLSTEQILHPDKYLEHPDLPMQIDLGTLDVGEIWKELGRNVVGEMQMGVLLRRYGGKRAAAGWDGDRYAVFSGPFGHVGLVWFTTWDSERDAREFQNNYVRFQRTKFGEEAGPFEEVSELTRRIHESIAYLTERKGSDVLVIEGFPNEMAERLREPALRATKVEMTYPDREPATAKPNPSR